MAWHAVDNSIVKIGYVVRDGELILAKSVDVVDAHGGRRPHPPRRRGPWELADGSSLHAKCTVVNGVVTGNHGVVWIDSLCEVVLDDGRTGYCDFEMSTNPRAGTRPRASPCAPH